MKAIKDIMTEEVSSCMTKSSLVDAAKLMKEYDVGVIPICGENRELIGIVTDRDLVLRGYANELDSSSSVEKVMSDHLFYVDKESTLQEASQMMAEHQVRRLPVVEQGKLIGIVSIGDLSLDEMSDQAAGQALGEISEHPEMH